MKFLLCTRTGNSHRHTSLFCPVSYFSITACKLALLQSRKVKWQHFFCLFFYTSFCKFKHSKMISLLPIECLETWNNWLWLHAESILLTKCCTCSTKGRPFPHRTKDQVEEECHVLPFMMLIYLFLFEMQKEVWVLLSTPMCFRPSAICLLHYPNKVLSFGTAPSVFNSIKAMLPYSAVNMK